MTDDSDVAGQSLQRTSHASNSTEEDGSITLEQWTVPLNRYTETCVDLAGHTPVVAVEHGELHVGVRGEPLKQRRLVLHRVRRDDRQAIPSAHRRAMNLSRTAPSDD